MPSWAPNLARQALLSVHFKLQFLAIEFDERLSLLHCVADIGQDSLHPALDFGAQCALFERKQRSNRLNPAPRRLFDNRMNMSRCGASPARLCTVRLAIRAPADKNHGAYSCQRRSKL